MPLIIAPATPSTFVQAEEPTQPQAQVDQATTPNTPSSSMQQPGAVERSRTQKKAMETSANHRSHSQLGSSSSRLSQGRHHTLPCSSGQAELTVLSLEDLLLYAKSFRNTLNYTDYAQVRSNVQDYCCSLWCDFTTFVGLSCTNTHWISGILQLQACMWCQLHKSTYTAIILIKAKLVCVCVCVCVYLWCRVTQRHVYPALSSVTWQGIQEVTIALSFPFSLAHCSILCNHTNSLCRT